MIKKLLFGLIVLGASFSSIAQENHPRVLPASVNSGSDEWAPVISPDGKTLYFSRLTHSQNMGAADAADIWVAYRYPGGQWPEALNAGAPLNSRQAEQPVAVHASGQRLYLYRPESGRLYYSNRRGRTWQAPAPIFIDSFSLAGKAANFSFSSDGSVLLISITKEDSRGGRDIYASFAQSDSLYSYPKSLGPQANSSFDEIGIFLAADNETLYFSSGRPGGLGGQDLYLSRRLDDSWANWSAPVNLGPAANTAGDDLFISMPASGGPVYLIQQNQEGAKDIFEASLPDNMLPAPAVLLSGAIKDAASGQVLDAAEAWFQHVEQDGEVMGGGAIDHEGRFQLILPPGHDVMLNASLEGYFPASERLELSGQSAEELDQDNSLLLASLNRDLAYTQRNEEIVNLQLHLRKIDDELIALNEQRIAQKKAIAAHLGEGPRSFESITGEVQEGLAKELAPKAGQELSAGLLEEAKREVAPTLTERERQLLALKEEDLRREIRQSFGPLAGKAPGWAAKGQTAETGLEHKAKGGLKATNPPPVQEKPADELKDDIRAALRNDIAYWAKKETRAEMQAELNEKIQQQIEQEKRKVAFSPAAAESVAPLTPAGRGHAEYQEVQQDLLLIRAEPGKAIPLNTLAFESNKANLAPISYPELQRVVEFLRHNPRLAVEIGVHCGGQLSHTNALSLSTQRAKTIINYLISQGVDEDRLTPKGYGKAFPIADNNTLEGQRLNQRVEMRILSKAD